MDDRSRALLALGIVFLSVPLWAPALDVTGQDYVYERANVTIEGERIVLNASTHDATPSEQIACFGRPASGTDRHCWFEYGLLTAENGSLSVDGLVRESHPDYVVFGMDGRPYERTEETDHDVAETVIALEPADPETVLDRVSWDPQNSPGVDRALETGHARADERLIPHSAVLFESKDGYAVVYQTASPVFLTQKPLVERGFEGISLAIGAILLYRLGRRTADER